MFALPYIERVFPDRVTPSSAYMYMICVHPSVPLPTLLVLYKHSFHAVLGLQSQVPYSYLGLLYTHILCVPISSIPTCMYIYIYTYISQTTCIWISQVITHIKVTADH